MTKGRHRQIAGLAAVLLVCMAAPAQAALDHFEHRGVLELHPFLGVPTWPPDMFAVTATLLARSGAYVNVVDAWPPKSPTRSRASMS